MQGDRQFGIRSFSVRAGQSAVLRLAIGLLVANFSAAALGLGFAAWAAQSTAVAMRRGAVATACLAAGGTIWRRSAGVPAEDSRQVYRLYMFLWATFYGAYLGLPLAR